MLQRVLPVAVAAFLVGCGGQASETKQKGGIKAGTPVKPEPTEEGKKIAAKLAETAKSAQMSLEKEEIVKPPVATDFFLLSEAYRASGFRVEALRKKIEQKETRGVPYVKLVSFNNLPEEATLYDDMGNKVGIVSYLWDDKFTVWGAVEKSASERMVGMYLYCPTAANIYVHDLSTFRVHAPFTRKLTVADNTITVELVDGHDLKGELVAWPKCEDVAESQEKAGPYQSPFGGQREVYSFDQDGNLVSLAYYDHKGNLVEDIHGVARKELVWKGNRISEEAWFAQDGLIGRYKYTYDDKGNLITKAVLDADHAPAVDYFGVSSYEYVRDKRGRISREVQKDVSGNPIQTIEYTYGKFNQVETKKVFDGEGNLVTTYVHEFNKKGARVSLSIYEGDPKNGKLKVDENGVALYRFDYTNKGKLLRESRHGSARVVDAQGKEDFMLVNALDEWALVENTYDEESSKLKSTRYARVDAAGNVVLEQFHNEEGELTHRIERTLDAGRQLSAVKTVYKEGMPEKKYLLDARDNITAVAHLRYNSDGLLQETTWYQPDEASPGLGPEGYHKMVRTYEDQRVKSDTYFDLLGAKLKTIVYNYAQDGSFKGTKSYDAEGKEI